MRILINEFRWCHSAVFMHYGINPTQFRHQICDLEIESIYTGMDGCLKYILLLTDRLS